MEENFNWVKARAECSVAQMFEMLRLQVGEDVENRNSHPLKLQNCTLKMVPSAKSFSVVFDCDYDAYASSSVTFTRTANDIQIRKENEKDPFLVATITLNDEGQCKFKVNGEEKESWQLRRMALEELFFG